MKNDGQLLVNYSMNVNDFDTKNVVPDGKETVIGTPEVSGGPDIFLQPIADILGGDINKHSKELTAIKEFVSRDNPNATNEDLVWGVRELLMRMGTPKFGESNLDRLYQYVYLRNEKDSIEKKLNTLSGKV